SAIAKTLSSGCSLFGLPVYCPSGPEPDVGSLTFRRESAQQRPAMKRHDGMGGLLQGAQRCKPPLRTLRGILMFGWRGSRLSVSDPSRGFSEMQQTFAATVGCLSDNPLARARVVSPSNAGRCSLA